MTAPDDTREFSLTRHFAAPRALVWRAWTDPKHLAAWWGPRGFTNPVCQVDLRVGGLMRIVMRSPDGQEFPMRGEFKEIVPPERLVFANHAVDAEDRALIDGLTTITLTERDGGTDLHLHTRAKALAPIAVPWLGGMEHGWTQSIDKLGDHLSATM
jgi:uncharacterized protein YndB with AHSA1/START domain